MGKLSKNLEDYDQFFKDILSIRSMKEFKEYASMMGYHPHTLRMRVLGESSYNFLKNHPLWKQVRDHFKSLLRKHHFGINTAQNVYRYIIEHPHTSLRDISERFKCSPNTILNMLKASKSYQVLKDSPVRKQALEVYLKNKHSRKRKKKSKFSNKVIKQVLKGFLNLSYLSDVKILLSQYDMSTGTFYNILRNRYKFEQRDPEIENLIKLVNEHKEKIKSNLKQDKQSKKKYRAYALYQQILMLKTYDGLQELLYQTNTSESVFLKIIRGDGHYSFLKNDLLRKQAFEHWKTLKKLREINISKVEMLCKDILSLNRYEDLEKLKQKYSLTSAAFREIINGYNTFNIVHDSELRKQAKQHLEVLKKKGETIKMIWNIDKTFEFDYGHSVWTQKLLEEFSICNKLVCRHEHGHRGVIKVSLSAQYLDNKGMVIDFKELDWFKKWVDDTLDHKMIIDINDPGNIERFYFLFSELYPIHAEPSKLFEATEILIDNGTHKTIDLEKLKIIANKFVKNVVACTEAEKDLIVERILDRYEGIIFVDFVPTSENLSRWIHKIVSDKLHSHPEIKMGRVSVTKIDFWETPKSHTEFKSN